LSRNEFVLIANRSTNSWFGLLFDIIRGYRVAGGRGG
jgi:hypothetical protein